MKTGCHRVAGHVSIKGQDYGTYIHPVPLVILKYQLPLLTNGKKNR